MPPKKAIYLDHQASTPAFEKVVEAMLPFWREAHGNPHSAEHSVGWAANKTLENARGKVAEMIGALPSEIAFTSGATEANNLAIYGLATGSVEQIVTTAIEHASIQETAIRAADERGLKHIVAPVDESGFVDLAELKRMLNDKASLVSIGLVNNEIGTIQKLSEISEVARSSGALLHTDAAQSPFAIDLGKLADLVDAASFSGHKMGGPMGVGAFYASARLHTALAPRQHGGGQEFGLRSGTVPVPLCVGLATAAEIVSDNSFDEKRAHMRACRGVFLGTLEAMQVEFEINGAEEPSRHPGNLNIRFTGVDSQDLILSIQPNVAASTGSACSGGKVDASHVLLALGLSDGEASSSLRISFGPSTHFDEVEMAAKILARGIQE